jgi:hypothetical protein
VKRTCEIVSFTVLHFVIRKYVQIMHEVNGRIRTKAKLHSSQSSSFL